MFLKNSDFYESLKKRPNVEVLREMLSYRMKWKKQRQTFLILTYLNMISFTMSKAQKVM